MIWLRYSALYRSGQWHFSIDQIFPSGEIIYFLSKAYFAEKVGCLEASHLREQTLNNTKQPLFR